MSHRKRPTLTRRSFVRQTGILAGGILAGSSTTPAEPAAPPSQPVPAEPARDDWSRRVLGRTGVPVTTMTLGTAPCGICKDIPPTEIAEIVNHALDLGIDSVDTAPLYKQAEEGVGLALGKRRKDVFLATKVWADTLAEAEQSLSNSLKLLKTDCVDLLYYHGVGNREFEPSTGPQGVFTWLVKQRDAGKCRFLGISGHHMPARFAPFLETGEVDVLLTVVNFVDRHTYGFEDKVLPVARKHNVGIVAMKVFGGASKSHGSYENAKAPPMLDLDHLALAVRYSLGVPGVATVNLGVHNKEQVRKNIEMVRNYRPLSPEERHRLQQLGKELAGTWGPHFGPVEETA